MALNEAGPARFTIGGVIATSFTVLLHDILRFLAIMVAIVAPAGGLIVLGGFLYAALGQGDADLDFTLWFSDPAIVVLAVYAVIVFLVGYSLVLAAITHGTLQALRGEPVGIGTCLGEGFRVLPKMFLAVLIYLVVLGLIVGVAVWAIYSVLWDWTLPPDAIDIAWAVAFGAVGAVLVALVTVLTWVFVPAVAAERAGPIACFRRSLALTKGRRWAVLALVVLTALANCGLSFLTELIEGAGAPTLGEVLDLALTAFMTALSAVLSAVGYARLRGEKEGVVSADVVKVFE